MPPSSERCADARERHGECGALRGQQHVRLQRETEAGAIGRAIDRRDHRDVQLAQLPEHAMRAVDPAPDEVGRTEVRVGADHARAHQLDVAAGTEAAAGAGDDQCPDAAVAVDAVDQVEGCA